MQVFHILKGGDLLVCPVIVIRDLDHYCFAIHSIVVPKSLVELFESLCISYVNINKTFYKPSSNGSFCLFYLLNSMYFDVCNCWLLKDNLRWEWERIYLGTFIIVRVSNLMICQYLSANLFCIKSIKFFCLNIFRSIHSVI